MRSLVIGWLIHGALLLSGTLLLSHPAPAWAQPSITLMRSPSCDCCSRWGEQTAAAGFAVRDVVTEAIDQVKHQNGIPEALSSCHTALVEGYVIEGHVPAPSIQRLLKERPDIQGLTAPGMPMGSPGMDGPGIIPEPFDVLAITSDGNTHVFDRYSS